LAVVEVALLDVGWVEVIDGEVGKEKGDWDMAWEI
jgi:hypothetical protein